MADRVIDSAPESTVVVPFQAPGYHYLVVPPGGGPADFMQPGFTDAAFSTGSGGFGSGGGCAVQGTRQTNWPTNTDILIRKTIDLPPNTTDVQIIGGIDNDLFIYWNGELLGQRFHEGCPTATDFTVPVPQTGVQNGQNVLAVRARDRGVESWVDLKVVATLHPLTTPTVAAGPDQSVVEGAIVHLDGSGSADPSGAPLSYAWALTGRTGPPVTLSSTTSATPTFQTADDGVYRFALTVSNGTEHASDEVVVTVTNAVPVLSVQADPAYEKSVALITTTFTDAGILDTHHGVLTWGDGSAPQTIPVDAQGSGWGTLVASHVYVHAGSFTVVISVVDDDGGIATTTVTSFSVQVPVAIWANSNRSDAAMETTSGAATFEGLVHTNDDLRIRGGSKIFRGPTEYVRTLDVAGSGATFDPAAVRTAVKPLPLRFDLATYRPGGSAAVQAGAAYHDMSASCAAGVWQVTGSTLASGIYYASCSVKLNGTPLGGTITVAAEGNITVSGSGVFFDPYTDGLLFLSGSTSTSAIRVDAAGSTFFGYSYAEHGRVVLTGANDRFYCGILADQIDISSQNLLVHGSACSPPARTVAPPTIVPALSLDLTVDRADALPGASLLHTVTITNTGSTIVVPGILGLENLGTATATVSAHGLALEYLSATDHAWHPVPGTITTNIRPNAFPGVTYPGGANTIDGATIPAGALASWGYAAVVSLDAAQTSLLLDPARVTAIRVTSSFTTAPDTVPVRRLFRFGDDFAGQLRTLGADAANVSVTIVPPAGDARVFGPSTTPALASLTPGEAVSVSYASTVPVPAAHGATESDAAYVARLTALDGTPLVGTAFGRGTAGIGPVLAPADVTTTTRHLPVVTLDKTGPADLEPGSTAVYDLAIANGGSAEARGISLTDTLAGVGARPVTGAPTTLAPAASATAHASYAVPATVTNTTLVNSGAVTWTDAGGNAYGPVTSSVTTRLIPARKLVVTKTDATSTSGGQLVVDYDISITNVGAQTITAIVLSDNLDPYTTLVAGSVRTSQGTITIGSDPSDIDVMVNVGTIASGGTVSIGFRVAVTGSVPDSMNGISNQATVTSDQLDPVLSDDPDGPGATDPTTTAVVGTGGGGGGGGEHAHPSIGTTTPDDGTVITEPTRISAVITPAAGFTLASWSIGARPVDATTDTVLASATVTGPGPLTATAAFDPTVLPNGTYLVTVTAVSSDGGTQSSTTSLIVDGNLKLGRYRTTYQDVSVGVAGLPMRVLRTYDSFDHGIGDFGHGWNVELANFRVQVNRPLGYGGWSQQAVNCGFIFCTTRYHSIAPHTATVIWPDGHQEIFDLTPADGSTFFAPATAAVFTGRSRSTSTLAADGDTSLSFFGDGNLYGGGFGSGGVYDPQRFRLTAVDGTVYLLDRSVGLISATDRQGNTLTVGPNGIISSEGPSITFERDPLGRIKKISEPGGTFLTYQYDAAGDLVTVTDQAGRDERFGYVDHFLASIGGSSGPPLRTIAYTPDGRIDTITDGDGNVVSLDMDIGARTETLTGPDPGLTTILTLDAHGDQTRVDQIFQGKHLVSHFVNNDLGLPLETTDPLGHTSTATYDATGMLTSLRDLDGVLTEVTYNGFSEVIDVKVGGQLKTHFDYFPNGLLQRMTYPDSTFAEFGYDPQGHLTSTRDRDGISRTIHYDPAGFPDVVTSPEGVSRMTHDPIGRVRDYTDPLGFATSYVYDGAGNLTSITDENHHTRTFGYDALGRLSLERDAVGQDRTYTYDGAGRIATVRDRNDAVTTLTYSPGGAPLTSTSTDGTHVTNSYDALGRLLATDNGTAVIEVAYDDASRPISERLVGHAGTGLPTTTLGRTWTDGGQPKTVTDSVGTTTFGYDGFGRLDRASDPQTGAFTFAYDPSDRLIAMARPNGVADSYVYTDGRLSSWKAQRGLFIVDELAFEYDDRGYPFRITDGDGIHTYDHDALGRLTAATHPAASGLAAETYLYDGAGNRLDWVGNPPATVSYDNANRLLSDGMYTFTYDDEGRLTSRRNRATGAITAFTWNARGQLLGSSGPSATVNYRYDPAGRRLQSSVNGIIERTIYDGANPRLILDGSNAVRSRLVDGLGFDGILGITTSGTTTFPIAGSSTVRATTDSSGGVVDRFRYDSFGNPGSGTTPSAPHAWQGLTVDPTGMYDVRARTYDPSTGRFLSEDPIPSMNGYAYAANSPLMASDPTGLMLAEYGSENAETESHQGDVCTAGLQLAGFTMDIALDVGLNVALAPFSGVTGLYEFFDVKAGKNYVGRSVDIVRRLSEHLDAGRITLDSKVNVRALANIEKVAEDGLSSAEQLAIDTCGTPGKKGTGSLANQINAINRARRDKLKEVTTNLADYLTSLGY